MTLKNLDARYTGKMHTIPARMPDDLWNMLEPYRSSGNAAGFIRLATRLLLGLTRNDDALAESAADHLAIGAGSLEELEYIGRELATMAHRVDSRVREIRDNE